VTEPLAGPAPAVLLVWGEDGRCTAVETAAVSYTQMTLPTN
jgi:hypothetical protein